MAFARFEGRRLHYTDSGPPYRHGDDAAPTLLFLHAYTTHSGLWAPMVTRFAPKYRVLAMDLPGHGQSDPFDEAREIAFLARCAVAVLDDASVTRAHVCGLSIGGMIGQLLGLNHAERLHSLTLACTSARLDHEARDIWDERLAQTQRKGLWSQIGPTMARWYGAGLVENFGPADLDPIARMIGNTSLAGALSCGLAVKNHDVLDQLAALTTPTLVIGADKDLSFPPSHPQALAGAIPGARLAMLANAGHMAPVQVPDAFEAQLASFVNDVDGA